VQLLQWKDGAFWYRFGTIFPSAERKNLATSCSILSVENATFSNAKTEVC
jgi:hypothetical protein